MGEVYNQELPAMCLSAYENRDEGCHSKIRLFAKKGRLCRYNNKIIIFKHEDFRTDFANSTREARSIHIDLVTGNLASIPESRKGCTVWLLNKQ